ncbi:sensor histidine kinase [Fulvivirga lutimaris]|uniref:sensor histidine kinase n=1 Tax=Fulvivirga lutimaris TaxID=1819566 RepID=UPI0012BC4A9C|nr:ATP-binding protein [Fulvivirga lutimaris]MTI38893.1 GHKL domain-containing protein [Fulvivirga lutimaris]
MKSYRLKILLHIILMVLTSLMTFYVLVETDFWLLSIWLILGAILQSASLIRLLERHQNELKNFLLGIQQNDFTNSYSNTKTGEKSNELHMAYNAIIGKFRQLKHEKESNYHFLQTIVEHSLVPMIGYYEDDERVTLINDAAKTLFNKPFFKTISRIKSINADLYNLIIKLESGGKELIKVFIGNELLNLSVSVKEIKMEDHLYKLVSFQNINRELEANELESWQKLIRVLTHEIKNSAIPISTLTEVVNSMIIDDSGRLKDLSVLKQDELDDLHIGLKTVEKRSKGLVNFVNAYGELSKLPQPNFKETEMKEVIDSVVSLLSTDLKKSNIDLKLNITRHKLVIDPELIEQVLINLIKNAKEALINKPEATILIESHKQNNIYQITVEDNGSGIDKETLQNIFIPFYTTKKEGSGIGLSLSKQIMQAHKGAIHVSSVPEQGTCFTLSF